MTSVQSPAAAPQAPNRRPPPSCAAAPRPPARRPLSRAATPRRPGRPLPQSCAAAPRQPEAPPLAGPATAPQRLARQSRAASDPARLLPRRKAEPGGTGKPTLRHTRGNPLAVREGTARTSKRKRYPELSSSPTTRTGQASLTPPTKNSTPSKMASKLQSSGLSTTRKAAK
jgi:hypothetical protein